MLTCLILSSLVAAQIKVISPADLSAKFTDGQVIGSTSTFGAPFYGESVVGRLIYRKPVEQPGVGPHCTKESYTNYKELEEQRAQLSSANEHKESGTMRKEKTIFLVRRGGCSFVTKVRVAEEFGADAVIVMDKEESSLTRDTIHTVIMADDGYGAHIKIPSILVSHEDGNVLEESARTHKDGELLVTLNWDVPSNDIVIMDLWMSSASKAANDFLKDFSPFAEKLSYKLQFVPRFHIYDLSNDFNSFCLQTNTFCANDPDGAGPITGKNVVEEDLRQLCLWHATTENDPESSEVKLVAKKPTSRQVRRSNKFWEYVGRYYSVCTLSATEPSERFGSVECSENLMRALSINVDKVNACIRDQGTKLLVHERENAAWSAFALRINGWRYAGHIEASLVAKAICAGYTTPPDACNEVYVGAQPLPSGFSLGNILLGIIVVCGLLAACLYLYHSRFFTFYVRRALHEEVMLEVQSQMAEYKVLGEDEELIDPAARPKRIGRLPRWG